MNRYAAILKQTAHRPWPLPSGPWVMTQTWHNLLFAHWPIPFDILRPLIPASLEVDTFAGQAWIGLVPFKMSNIRVRGLPYIPGTARFPELNVRTYVTLEGKAGVFFFTLEAASRLAVAVARRWFHLPYHNAEMRVDISGETINYFSQRTHKNASPARFEGTYGSTGDIFAAKPGSLEHWLTERYCLYAVSKRGKVYRSEIQHQPWPVQPAEANITANTVAQAHGIELPPSPPHLLYAQHIEVLIWPPKRLK